MEPLTAWSFSRLSQYEICPAKIKFSVYDKIKEPGNAAMERGAAIHEKAERYIRGMSIGLPDELKKVGDYFKELKRNFEQEKVFPELSIALTKDWRLTNWFADDCWLRVKIDCVQLIGDGASANIFDWKTGKPKLEWSKADYDAQLELYALAAMLKFEELDHVFCLLLYVDAGVAYPNTQGRLFTRDDIPGLKAKWEKRVVKMMSDTAFLPTPNRLCQWCYYSDIGKCKY